MIYLSKSKYCGLWQCPKIAWLRKYKPEEWVLDDGTLARMEAGNEVGDLAMGLFGDFVEVTAYTDGKLDLNKLFFISDVAEEVKTEIQNIEPNLAIAEKILQSEEEPDIDLNMGCHRRAKSERHG